MSGDKVSLRLLSEHRTAIMGVATMLVSILHYYQILGVPFEGTLKGLVSFFSEYCEYGVDTFLFLSGFGLFFAMEKKEGLVHYYIRRFLRIAPEYSIIIVLSAIFIGYRIRDCLLLLTGTYYWFFGEITDWYIALIYFLYLTYPLLHKAVAKHPKATAIVTLTISVILLAASLLIGDNELPRSVGISRIPVFILGALTGRLIKNDVKINTKYIIYLGVLAFFCVDVSLVTVPNGFVNRFLFIPSVLFTALASSLVFSRLKEGNLAVKGLEALGKISLPFYLINMRLTIYMRGYEPFAALPRAVQILASLILTILMSYPITWICNRVRKIENKT